VNGGNVATVGVRTDAYASNLILAVPLNATTQDYSGQINNSRTPLTFSVNGNAASTTTQSNFYGGSYTFDGSTDSVYSSGVSVPNSDALFLQNSNSTVECWVRIASGQTDDRYFIALASGSSSNAEGSWYIRIFQSKFEFVTVNGNTQYKTTGVSNYVPDKWTHIAFVREGNEQRLYQDGVLVVTTSHTVLPNVNNSSTLFIGSSYGYSNTINGQIQDVRVYDNVAKYTSNFIPAATNPDILPDTPSGVAHSSELTEVIDGAVAFDGSGDYLSLAGSSDFNFGTDNFTLEGFFYKNSTTTFQTLLCSKNYYTAGNDGNWVLRITSGTQIAFATYDGTSNGEYTEFTALNGIGGWHHFALVREGTGTNQTKFYYDGKLAGSTTISKSLTDAGTNGIFIGDDVNGPNGAMNGFLSNVRIIKGTALYTADFTPPTEPLTNVTNTKLLCCQSATSASAATVAPGTFVNDGTNYSSNNQVTGSAGLVNADSIFNGHLRASGVPALNEGATVTLSSDNYILWTPTTGIPYSSKVEIYCYAPNGYNITTYYTFNGGTETSFVGGTANYNGNTWITVATGSGTINSIKLRLTRTAPDQSQATWYAVRVDGTILLNDQNGKSIGRFANTSATNFSPFTTDINAVRGQETRYTTLNPLNTDNISTFSDGNLSTVCVTGSGQGATSGGNIPVDSGKWYCEMVCTAKTATNAMIGVCTIDGFDGQRQIDESQNGGSGYGYVMNGTKIPGGASYGTTWAIGDVIGVALDLDSSQNTVTFYKNGVSQGPINITNARYVFGCSNGQGSSSVTYSTNFGQKPFKYAPPEGFKTLCLANLPRPTKAAVRPDKYFKTMLWTGDDSTDRSITTGFRPDFVWVRARNQAYSHHLYDSVRGPSLRLLSNGTQSEFDQTSIDGVSSFNSDGFDVSHTNSDAVNQLNTTYVAWSWKAGGNSNTFNVDGVGYANASDVNMNVGGLNSSVYNQSQNWTALGTGDGAGSPYDWEQTFDGNSSTYGAIAPQGASLNLDLSGLSGGGISYSQSVVITYNRNSSAPDVTVNGSAIGATADGTDRTYTLTGSGLLTSVGGLERIAAGSGDMGIKKIVVDGKELVDAGVSVTNVPSMAATGASVNTESGFSIITYTGDGSTSSGVTINHGLGETPAFIITKKRSSGTTDYGWSCWHKDIGGNYGIWLNSGNGRNPSMWAGHTNISSNVFSPPDLNYGNENNQTYVNYIWSEVPGYSKFGTYTGNGNATGPFVECGFKPALIITKQLNGGNSWFMVDTTREPTNPAGRKWILSDSSGSEVTNNNKDFDILSNGFKPRLVTGYHNDGGVPYLYMAWAEVPTFNLYGGQSNAR
tara:strand:- start:7 stop:4023 length:4017 start_codon:yes stop_codon:yes gene_type:complete